MNRPPLVQRHDERRLPHSQKLYRLDGLLFQSVQSSPPPMAMSQREEPLERRFVNDSWPGVSMITVLEP